MPYSSGSQTKDIFRWGPEAHKLHLEFEVSGSVHAGELVKLTTDGKVVALADGDNEEVCIGVSIHTDEHAYGDYVVVAVRGYAVIMAQVDADTNCGPAEYGGYDGATDRPIVAAGQSGNFIGWILDASGEAGDVVRFLLKD